MTDISETTPDVLGQILSPAIPLIRDEALKIEGDADTYRLSFSFFTFNILYAIIKGIGSINLLITHIRTSPHAKELKLADVSKSMYSEAFGRYSPSAYRHIFYALLESLHFMGIPEIRELGVFHLTDGSVFPAVMSMTWASYKKKHNAIRLRLAFELNRMIPAQFLTTPADTSEKKILLRFAEAGVTYICDRGYVSFGLFAGICEKGADFIIRGKSNHVSEAVASFLIDIPHSWKSFLKNLRDMTVVFENDSHGGTYRIVSFTVRGEDFVLTTSRFDLKTYQIIMLYAYRWQVELMFRFLKRTLCGIHLMSHRPEGIEIQFILYMTACLLLPAFRQECIKSEENRDEAVAGSVGESSAVSEQNSSACLSAESEEDRDEAVAGGVGESSAVSEQNSSACLSAESDENRDEAVAGSIGEFSAVSEQNSSSALPDSVCHYSCGLVSLSGKKLQKYWKTGIHWLTAVRNLLAEPFTPEISKLIASV